MKKKLNILFFCLFWSFSNAQLISQINEALRIPDSLSWDKEIRVYEFENITNSRSLFRLYQNDDKSWNVEYSKYYYSLEEKGESEVLRTDISYDKNFELLWLKILKTDIQYLTQWKNVEYKLKEKGEIKFDRGEYELLWKKKTILDGKDYMVIFRSGDKFNSITYPNPKDYLKHYPTVDEIDSINQLLDLIEMEFELSKI